jgi:hypothetical protein
MPRCTVCAHGERGAIEASLCRGTSYRALSKRHGLSVAALGRHRRSHVPEPLRDKLGALALVGCEVSLDALRRDESAGLLGHLVNQRARLYAILDLAEDQDLKVAAAIHARLTATLELTAKLLDQIGGHSTTIQNNLIVAPEYLALRAALLKALAPPEFRAARQAVSVALRAIESTTPERDAIDAVAVPLSGPVTQ